MSVQAIIQLSPLWTNKILHIKKAFVHYRLLSSTFSSDQAVYFLRDKILRHFNLLISAI